MQEKCMIKAFKDDAHFKELQGKSGITTKDLMEILLNGEDQITKAREELEKTEQDLMKSFELNHDGENDESLNEIAMSIFRQKHSRDPITGRYVVPMIWHPHAPKLGPSRKSAERFFYRQEWKLLGQKAKQKAVNEFMDDYESKRHMIRIEGADEDIDNGSVYYIPHLSIIREDSITTKLRQVFHASYPSLSGESLNSILIKGPDIGGNIFTSLMRLRQWPIVFCGDVSQMFRQVQIPEEDSNILRILFRPTRWEPLRTYRLTTVTYGTACAMFQSVMAMRQCATDNAPSQEIERIIHERFYVDDFVSGCFDIEEGKKQLREVRETLKKGCFPLTKFESNEPEVLKEIPEELHLAAFKGGKRGEMKLLGNGYSPIEDEFFQRKSLPEKIEYTKRGMLSVTAAIYDPLGFVLPVIMMLRILMQDLWLAKVDWDEKLNEEVKSKFQKIIDQLPLIMKLKIPRWLGNHRDQKVQLVGFCDSSFDGMAACVYSRVINDGKVIVRLVASYGRLENAEVDDDLKHPILVPRGHLADLIIKRAHIENNHCATTLMMSAVMRIFFIPALKQRVKYHINKCAVCLRWRAAVAKPQMASLPLERITPTDCFAHTGVDLAGHFECKASRIKFDKIIKLYVVIFVCLFSKALHLEVVSDISTASLIQAIARLTARRGAVRTFYSDNAKNFQGFSNALKKTWQKVKEETAERLAMQKTNWVFINPYAPMTGGLWEAAVKSMKFFTNRFKNVSSLTHEDFVTLICRIEGLLNSRPITPDPADPLSLTPITPFKLMTMKDFRNNPFDDDQFYSGPITKQWLLIVQIQKQMWNRFKKEYLQTLQARQKWAQTENPIKVNDIVLLKDNDDNPGVWKMGRVTEAVENNKGQVTTIKVDTQRQNGELRSVRTVVPIVRDNEETPEPVLGRVLRKRNVTKGPTALVTLVLFTWLAATTQNTNAQVISKLEPGINFVKLNKVHEQIGEFLIQIQTNINFQADFDDVKERMKMYENLCKEHEFVPNIKQKCVIRYEAAKELVSNTEKKVRQEIFNHRSKRQIYATLVKAGSTVLSKASSAMSNSGPLLKHPNTWTVIGTSAGIGVSLYEAADAQQKIDMLKQDIDRLRNIQTKTAAHILQLEDVRYDSVEMKLDQIKEDEKIIQLETEMNQFENNMLQLIEKIKLRYENAGSQIPIEVIESQINKVREKLNGVNFTISAKEILESPAKKSLINDCLLISWKVKLVQNEEVRKLEKTAFISIPSKGMAQILESGKLITRRILDRKNMLETINDNSNVVKTEELKPMTNCTLDIILEKTEKRCERQSFVDFPPIVEILSDQIAVIISEQAIKISLKCEGEEKEIEEEVNFALINYHNCSLFTKNVQIVTGKINEKNISDTFEKPLLVVKDFTTNRNTMLLHEKIQEDINEMRNFEFSQGEEPNAFRKFIKYWEEKIWNFGWHSKLLLIIAIVAGAGMIFYFVKRRRSRSWTKEIIKLSKQKTKQVSIRVKQIEQNDVSI